MRMFFSFIEPDDFLFFGWVILVPVLVQIITLIIGVFIYLRKKFFYRNLNIASILTTSLTIFVIDDLAFSTKKDPQDGLVLVFLPFWTPFVWLFCFLVCSAFFYVFKDEVSKERIIHFKEYNSVTFWISATLVLFYALSWTYILISKAI